MNYNKLSFNFTYPDINKNPICPRAKLDTGTHCNYNCYFCYYKNSLNIKTDFDVIKQRIDFLYSKGIRQLDLSGGESSIHKDWFKILDYCGELDIYVSCLSNGLKFANYEFIKKSKEHGLKEILFSLHSIGETHERMTQIKGSYNKIIQAINNANQLEMLVRINSTLTNNNIHLVDNEYFDIVENLKPFEVNFLPLNYFSDGSNNELFNYNNLYRVKNFIDKSKIKYINVRYTPYCFMVGYEKHVVGHFQHIYDIYDWNKAMYNYGDCNDLETNIKAAKDSRLYFYYKPKKCINCKYFNICDGLEKQLKNTLIDPIKGEKITNILEYRDGFYNNN